MPDKINLVPLIGPLLGLLRSRKFMVAVITLIVDVIIAYAPAMEAVRVELLTVFTLIGSLVIAAIAHEDGQAKAKKA